MKSSKAVWTLVCLVLIAAAAVGAIIALAQPKDPEPVDATETGTASSEEEWSNTIRENGVVYKLNQDLETVLFLGVDDGSRYSTEKVAGSGGRADTILLLLLDDSRKTITLISISRDTMTEVDAYGTDGSYSYSSVTHLNMQYAYGDSPSRSAYLMKKTVSELLYGIRIDGFLSLEAEGIVRAVDSLGGLTVTIPEDYTEIDGRFDKGAKVTLTGAETERLLRFRDTKAAGSNETRVERQLRLIESVFREMGGKLSGDRAREILNAAGDAAATDLDAETMKKLATYTLEETSYTLPGIVREGEDHDEFYVDDAALRKLLIGLYYVPTGS